MKCERSCARASNFYIVVVENNRAPLSQSAKTVTHVAAATAAATVAAAAAAADAAAAAAAAARARELFRARRRQSRSQLVGKPKAADAAMSTAC